LDNTVQPIPEIKENKDILRPLRQMALIFFMVIGLAHIITGLMVSREFFTGISNLINKVLDIPFAMIGVIFGLSNIKISSTSAKKKTAFIFMGLICLLVLGLLLYINILIPDRV
jgi:hypothetical protein